MASRLLAGCLLTGASRLSFGRGLVPVLGEAFAQEDGGLGVVVEAGDFLVASAAVHGYGGLELGFGVEVDPGVAGVAGGLLGEVHEGAG